MRRSEFNQSAADFLKEAHEELSKLHNYAGSVEFTKQAEQQQTEYYVDLDELREVSHAGKY